MSCADSPPLHALEPVLHETTERLALECGRPGGTAPDWNEFQWCVAQAVASMHGISPLLSARLRWQGPRQWCEFIRDQRRQTGLRHDRIVQLLARIDAAARAASVPVLALKGVALHGIGIYEPGMRPMADVDLLVNPDDEPVAAALLAALGYCESARTDRHRTFEPEPTVKIDALGERAGRPIKIELHQRIAEQLPLREVDISALLRPVRWRFGLLRYESAAALMSHLLLHAAGNMRIRALRLVQLNDIAALAARLSLHDWDRILSSGDTLGARASARSGAWWAYPPLALTARYYPGAIPGDAMSAAASACPRMLRAVARRQTLADVSMSHLWIEFAPGWEWCRSIDEIWRYMRRRIFPGRRMLAEVHQHEATDTWAATEQWRRLSRPRRAIRWLIAPTPRGATIWTVGEAWRQAGRPL